MKATIYHNPMCGTSRKTLEILNNEGADVTVIEYLKAPPSREELKRLYERAGITPRDVDRTGIGPATAAWAREATGRGHRVRLVASARRGGRPVVAPVELPLDDLLAGLCGMANALVLETDTLGRVVIAQLDGGLTQTAYGLLGDVITVRRRVAGVSP